MVIHGRHMSNYTITDVDRFGALVPLSSATGMGWGFPCLWASLPPPVYTPGGTQGLARMEHTLRLSVGKARKATLSTQPTPPAHRGTRQPRRDDEGAPMLIYTRDASGTSAWQNTCASVPRSTSVLMPVPPVCAVARGDSAREVEKGAEGAARLRRGEAVCGLLAWQTVGSAAAGPAVTEWQRPHFLPLSAPRCSSPGLRIPAGPAAPGCAAPLAWQVRRATAHPGTPHTRRPWLPLPLRCARRLVARAA